MTKIAVLIIILLTILSTASAIIVLDHKSPMALSASSQARLELEVKSGFEEIQDAYIYYREIKTEAYQQLRLTGASAANPIFIAQLPAIPPNVEGYEYYFEIVRTDGQTQTLPEISPLRDPFRIMQEETAGESSGFVVLSPMGNEISYGDDFVLAISTYAVQDKLDKASLKIMVNGVDVTSSASITDNLIVYRQTKPRSGNVNFKISGKAKDGKPIAVPSMIFTVKHGNKLVNLPFNLRGNISFNSDLVSINAKSNASVSSTRKDDASTNFNLYGGQGLFKFNTKVYLSTLENKYHQPVDRYSLGLFVPSMDLIFGDNTPFFNSFTLNSTNIRGIYGKIYSKGFSMIGMYGQSKRKIDGKLSTSTPTLPGTFSRDTSGLRMQWGSLNGLAWSFNVVKSRDIISSLASRYYQRVEGADTTQISFPVDNLVMGSDLRLSLFKQSFILGLEGAGSLFNSNILPGPISEAEFEDYVNNKPPFGLTPTNVQDIFIINKNVEPFIPSIANIAMQGYMRMFFLKNYLSLSYSQIGSSFNSVAANYLQNDTRTINVSDNLNIKNVTFLEGGVNIISDNLSQQKAATSTYTNWYVQSLFRFQNLPYLRLGFHTNTGKNDQNTDIESVFNPMKTENDLFDVGVGYDFAMMPVAPTKVDLTFNTGSNEDKQNSSYELKTNNVLLSLTSRFQQMPLLTRITFNTASQNNKFEHQNDILSPDSTSTIKNTNTDFGLHGEYKLLEDKLIPFADFKTTVLGGHQEKASYQLFYLGARYMPLEATTVTTNLGFKTYTNSDHSNQNYSSVSWNLFLSQRF